MTSLAPFPPETRPDTGSDYRAVNVWAVASILLGVLSVTAALGWFFVFIPLAGGLAGWRALRQLRRFGEVQTGIALARAGVATSVFFGLSGAVFLHFVATDVPHGYKEITFADLQPDPGESVSRYAVELQPTLTRDPKVFIRGFIYPGRRADLRHAKRTMAECRNQQEFLNVLRSSAWVDEPSDKHLSLIHI